MPEVQDYESAYEGAQIDQAVGIALGIRTGSVQVEASLDGSGYATFDIVGAPADAKIFASAHGVSQGGNIRDIYANISLNQQTGAAVAYIAGNDVFVGELYQVDWLLVPPTS